MPTAAKSPAPKKRPAKSSGSAGPAKSSGSAVPVPSAVRRLRLLCGWPPEAPYFAPSHDDSDDSSFEQVEPGVWRHARKDGHVEPSDDSSFEQVEPSAEPRKGKGTGTGKDALTAAADSDTEL